MRTTIDLPDDVLRQAKIAAVERGTTLKELVGQALTRELGLAAKSDGRGRKRIKFPIFSSVSPGALRLTNADLTKLESEEDARRHGFTR
jgi:hypothetical protein